MSSPFPGKLSVLVMDNACIHHGDQILELCECFGEYACYSINSDSYNVKVYSGSKNCPHVCYILKDHFITQ